MADSSCSVLEPYALRVLGDSMEPEFADGCVIIIDPGYAPRDGSYVVVEFAGDVFFRQLVCDGERRFLKPLNRYPSRLSMIQVVVPRRASSIRRPLRNFRLCSI